MPSCPLAAPPRLGGGGTIREAPGFFPAPELSPRPAPGSSAPAAAFPFPGRGRPRAGAFAPPARGTGVGGAVVLRGNRLRVGVQSASSEERPGNGAPAVPSRRDGRGVQAVSLGRFTPERRTRSTRFGAAPSPPASSSAGRRAQGAESRRPLAFYPGVARPGGGADSHPGKREGEQRG